jgi:hypothetical protein
MSISDCELKHQLKVSHGYIRYLTRHTNMPIQEFRAHTVRAASTGESPISAQGQSVVLTITSHPGFPRIGNL